MSELKSCPFCGGKAYVKIRRTTCVECMNCTAMVLQKLDDVEWAINLWNKRFEKKIVKEKVIFRKIDKTFTSKTPRAIETESDRLKRYITHRLSKNNISFEVIYDICDEIDETIKIIK